VDFIKKNWGLLLVCIVCLLATGAVAWRLAASLGAAKESRAKLDKELEFYKGVKQDNVKLTEQNKATALQNADWAKDRFDRLRTELHKKFYIEVKYDADPYVAVQQLLTGLDTLRTHLADAEIALSTQSQYLSFEEYAAANVTPKRADMPELFRQYKVVEEIVNQLIASKVAMVNQIGRPLLLQKREEDLYTSIPIDISVTGTSQSVSDFLNALHTTARYLFFIRKIEISSQDQAPDGVLGGTGTTGGGAGGGGMGGMGGMGGGGMDVGMGGGMGGGMAMGRPGMGRPGFGAGPGGGGGGMDMGMDGGMGTAGTTMVMPVLLTREQLTAFQDRYITADIRLDLVEFTTPEEQQGE